MYLNVSPAPIKTLQRDLAGAAVTRSRVESSLSWQTPGRPRWGTGAGGVLLEPVAEGLATGVGFWLKFS